MNYALKASCRKFDSAVTSVQAAFCCCWIGVTVSSFFSLSFFNFFTLPPLFCEGGGGGAFHVPSRLLRTCGPPWSFASGGSPPPVCIFKRKDGMGYSLLCPTGVCVDDCHVLLLLRILCQLCSRAASCRAMGWRLDLCGMWVPVASGVWLSLPLSSILQTQLGLRVQLDAL